RQPAHGRARIGDLGQAMVGAVAAERRDDVAALPPQCGQTGQIPPRGGRLGGVPVPGRRARPAPRRLDERQREVTRARAAGDADEAVRRPGLEVGGEDVRRQCLRASRRARRARLDTGREHQRRDEHEAGDDECAQAVKPHRASLTCSVHWRAPGRHPGQGDAMATVTEHEGLQVERANASGLRPVVFIHGLWLLPTSWDRWAALFAEAGFAPLAPGWPDDPASVEEAQEHPEVFAGKTINEVADHLDELIGGLDQKPAVIGHSFGGLLTQILAGRGRAAVSVAIDPAPFRGVLPLPISALRSSAPVLANPLNWNRAVPLTYEQFRYAFANAVDEAEAKKLYDTYAVPAPGASSWSSRGSATTRPPGRSRTPRSSASSTTRASPRSWRSRAAGTRSPSITAGARWQKRRSRSSAASSRRCDRPHPSGAAAR